MGLFFYFFKGSFLKVSISSPYVSLLIDSTKPSITTPLVPLKQIPQYWSLSLKQFLEKSGTPTGWEWTSMLGYGDVVPLLGISILASGSLFWFLYLLYSFLQRGAKVLAFIAAVELFFILTSASNLIQISH